MASYADVARRRPAQYSNSVHRQPLNTWNLNSDLIRACNTITRKVFAEKRRRRFESIIPESINGQTVPIDLIHIIYHMFPAIEFIRALPKIQAQARRYNVGPHVDYRRRYGIWVNPYDREYIMHSLWQDRVRRWRTQRYFDRDLKRYNRAVEDWLPRHTSSRLQLLPDLCANLRDPLLMV